MRNAARPLQLLRCTLIWRRCGTTYRIRPLGVSSLDSGRRREIGGLFFEVPHAIKGHPLCTEGEQYGGEAPLVVKWREIKRLKRFEVSALTWSAPAKPSTAKKKGDGSATLAPVTDFAFQRRAASHKALGVDLGGSILTPLSPEKEGDSLSVRAAWMR